MRSTSRGFAPDADRRRCTDRRLHARRQLRELGRELDAVEIEHQRGQGSSSVDQLVARSASVDSTMTRVYSCAGHSRADAIRAAAAQAATARAAAPPAAAASGTARRRSSENARHARSGECAAMIARRHRSPAAVCARSASMRPRPSASARCASVTSRSATRQQPGDALGPFDQADAVVAEAVGESRRFPFAWIGEPIKIKVIEV